MENVEISTRSSSCNHFFAMADVLYKRLVKQAINTQKLPVEKLHVIEIST